MRFLLLILLSFSCAVLLGQKEYEYSNYLPFVENHKMGLREKENNTKVLDAAFDFISQTSQTDLFYTIKDNKIQVINVLTGDVLFAFAATSIKELVDRDSGGQWFVVDESITYKERFNENGDSFWEKSDKYPSIENRSSIEFYSSSLVSSYLNNKEEYYVLDEYDEPSFDEMGDPMYETYGGVYIGLFDVKKMTWALPPHYSSISKVGEGYLAIEPNLDSVDKWGNQQLFYNYFDSNFDLLIKHKLKEEFTLSDTLVFFSKGAQLFNSIDSSMVYFQINGKMGAYEFDLSNAKINELVQPKYDYVVYCEGLGRFFTFNEGEFSEILLNEEDLLLPLVPKKSIQYFSDAETGESYVTIDGDINYEIYYDDADKYIWRKIKEPYSSNNMRFSLEYPKNDLLIQNINTLEEYSSYDDWGDELYDDYGEPVFSVSGQISAGIYSLKEKKWKGDFYSKINKTEKGFIVRNITKTPYYQTFLTGFCDANYNLKVQLLYSNLIDAGDFLIAKKGDSTGLIDKKGKVVLPLLLDYNGLKYLDGYYFLKGGEVLDPEFFEPMYDEDTGDVLYYNSVLLNAQGKPINIEYDPVELYSNGILEIINKGDGVYYDYLIGYYDLKLMKLIAVPQYDQLYSHDKQKIWLKKDNKWEYFKLGNPLKLIMKKRYDSFKIVNTKKGKYFITTEGENTQILNSEGKNMLPFSYKIGRVKESLNGQKKWVKVSKNNKKGLYSFAQNKLSLQPIYDSIIWSNRGYIKVVKGGKHGLIAENELDKKGDLEWLIEPSFPHYFTMLGSYIYYKKGGKMGLMNLKKEEVIPPQYSSISLLKFYDEFDEYFDGELYPEEIHEEFKVWGQVEKKNLQGIYSLEKGLIVPLKYEEIQIASKKGTYYVYEYTADDGFKSGYKWGLWDAKQGKELIPPIYQEISPIQGGKGSYWIKKDNLFGIVDSSGTVVLEPTFQKKGDKVSSSKKELHFVWKNDRKGLFNVVTNQYILQAEYEDLEWLWDEPIYIVKKDSKFGLFSDETSQLTEPIVYDKIEFIDGYLVLEKDLKSTVISQQDGKVLLSNIDEFRNSYNYIIIRKEGKVEFLSVDSLNLKWSAPYGNVLERNNSFVTFNNNKMGFLNFELDEIIKPQYDYVNELQNGLMLVGNKKPWSYLDQTMLYGLLNFKGEVVAPIEYDKIETSYNSGIFLTKGNQTFSLDEENVLKEVIE